LVVYEAIGCEGSRSGPGSPPLNQTANCKLQTANYIQGQ
jgi:hypothetical protein